MIDRSHSLSLTRQTQLLGISRGSVYYLPRLASEADLALMRRIDELHLEYPCQGSDRAGIRAIWNPGNCEYGPSKPIHSTGVHTRSAQPWLPTVHGWQRGMA